MKKNKLKIRELKVQSFITSAEDVKPHEILGGIRESILPCTGANCPISGIRNCFETIDNCTVINC
jgi:hypothetical protein